jgi:hypothetical protein
MLRIMSIVAALGVPLAVTAQEGYLAGECFDDETLAECESRLQREALRAEEPKVVEPEIREPEPRAEVREEEREVEVEPGIAEKEAEPGEEARAALSRTRREVAERSAEMGYLRRGTSIDSSITTNPLGWFTGDGINLEYGYSFLPKWSGVVSGKFARTELADRSATAWGVGGGADYFILGRNNEGLRVGPRFAFDFGGETVGADSDFANAGVGGELGYNWVAANGLTAQAGGGVLANVARAADAELENEDNFSPYLKLNLGYSW